MRKTSELPAGLPGHAVSIIDEVVQAVDGDNGVLYVRRRGKRTWQAISAPDLWKFRPALYNQHGWWCQEQVAHVQCAACIISTGWTRLVEPVNWSVS